MATSGFSDTSDSSGIDVDQILADAIKGDEESLYRLQFSEWFTTLLDQISTRWAYKTGFDKEEIRDAIFDKVSSNIRSIKNPNQAPLANCFMAWCEAIARNDCWNMRRHQGVEQDHRVDVAAHESIQGSRKSVEGGSIALRSTDENSPYDLYLEAAIAKFSQKVRANMRLAVRTALANSSPTDIRVVFLWGVGNMTLVQTGRVMGIATATVQRHLIAWQKQILQQPIVHQVLSRATEDEGNGLNELFRNALKSLCRAA